MALWEYKIIGSGKGGFGSPSLLESHLNQLGKDEWEIIAFHTNPENPLAFQGLARRTTQRDWTLQDAAAAAAKAEAEKLRAEFAAKFQAGQTPPAALEDKPSSLVGEVASPEDGFRHLRNTERDQDPEALADAEDGEDTLQLDNEDELPTFFDFIRPHMRRNQRGPGMSLAVDYLANKIDLSPSDIVSALKECGFEIPEREDDDPVYLEYDGDLFWVNTNRHHQLFINTKEKPRPVFRTLKAQVVPAPESRGPVREERETRAPSRDAAAPQSSAKKSDAELPLLSERATKASSEDGGPKPESGPEGVSPMEAAAPSGVTESETRPVFTPTAPSPASGQVSGGEALFARLRPMMRRNRRGPGVSGSVSFLSRALKQSDAELAASLSAVGLVVPNNPNEKPAFMDIGNWTYWINKDNRGGLWINGREKRERDRDRDRDRGDRSDRPAAGETPASETETPIEGAAMETPAREALVSPESAAPSAPSAREPSTDPGPNAPMDKAGVPPALLEGRGTNLPAIQEADPQGANIPEPTPLEGIAGEPRVGNENVAPAVPIASPTGDLMLADVRAHLKPKSRGTGVSAQISNLAEILNTSEDALLRVLVAAGMRVPENDEAKPVLVESGQEMLWLEESGKSGTLWLNAKSKPVRKPRAAGGSRKTARKIEDNASAQATE